MQEFRFNYEESVLLREFMCSLDFGRMDYTESIEELVKVFDKSTLPFTYVTITCLDPTRSSDGRMKIAVSGVKEYLGYNESDFTFSKSLHIMPGIYRISIEEYAKATYSLLQDSIVRRKISKDSCYTISYIVKHEKGHFLSVRRHSYIKNIEGNMSYLQINICHVNNRIKRGILMPKPLISHCRMDGFFDRENQLIQEIAIPKILSRIKKEIGKTSLLTPKQFEVATLLSQNLSSTEIASKLGMSANSVSKHNRSIIETISNWFPKEFDFKNAKEVAIYLQEIGFLKYMKSVN